MIDCAAWFPELPQHWDAKPLKYVASVNDEVLPETTSEDTDISYVEISDVSFGRGLINSTVMQFGNAPSRARRLVKDGDLIVSTVRTYLKAIASIELPEPGTTVSTGFAVLRPRNIDSSFLGHLFHHDGLIGEIISRSVGVSYPAINASEIMSLDVPVPPLPEQRIIAAYLDRETARIDGLVERLERLIALLTSRRQAVISHAVTKGLDPSTPMKDSGIDWLGEVPAHWEVKRLKHVMPRIEQGWSPDCEGRTKDEAEWGVLKAGCVNGWAFNENEHKALPGELEPRRSLEVKPGDLLMSRANTRDLVGSVALVGDIQERLLLCDKLYRLKIDQRLIEPAFAMFVLRSRVARIQYEMDATGASNSMQNIGQDTVQNLALALPPLGEQIEIARSLEAERAAVDEAQESLTSMIDRAKERRAALISAAVTGQIPLAEMTPHAEAAE